MKVNRLWIVLFFVLLSGGWEACSFFEGEAEINSIYFDGDFHLVVEADSLLGEAFSGDFAVEMWIMGDTVKTLFDRPIVSLSGGGEELFGVYESWKDSSVMFVSARGDTTFFSVLGGDYRGVNFYYVCVTRLYDVLYVSVNGSPVGRMNLLRKGFSVDGVYIGGNNSGNRWHGYLDEFRIWKCYKSPSFVSFHYKNPDKLCIHYAEDCLDDLVVLFRFNKSRSDKIPDEANFNLYARISGNISGDNWTDKGVD
ncbi:MAG: hypothetical protein DRP91_05265 [Candidatus Neomarinimicrobiota bacterium]|nr:MAG: hypothetical protein DRP91_05265 [Candidatus Neomarinimicrobiota bacterium]RKY53791.1 MAG: hypothetical protein DRP92_02690 [Candidatus Neomarinimicrobiota bacterium]